MMQAYGLDTDIETFLRIVLIGRAIEETEQGVYESNLVSNGCGGFEYVTVGVGTHYIFTIQTYMDRVRTLLPLFPDAVTLDTTTNSHRPVVKKLK